MIVLIGTNIQISESIADLLSPQREFRFLKVSNKSEVATLNLEGCFVDAKLIIVNLYGIYEEGVSLIKKLRQISETPIVALDSYESSALSKHLISCGANAYFSIYAASEGLNQMIEDCLVK